MPIASTVDGMQRIYSDRPVTNSFKDILSINQEFFRPVGAVTAFSNERQGISPPCPTLRSQLRQAFELLCGLVTVGWPGSASVSIDAQRRIRHEQNYQYHRRRLWRHSKTRKRLTVLAFSAYGSGVEERTAPRLVRSSRLWNFRQHRVLVCAWLQRRLQSDLQT